MRRICIFVSSFKWNYVLNVILAANMQKIQCEAKSAVKKYVSIGRRIAESSTTMKKIEDDVSSQIETYCNKKNPSLFLYAEGSSGVGKTQLAFSFKRKVLYIPFGK